MSEWDGYKNMNGSRNENEWRGVCSWCWISWYSIHRRRYWFGKRGNELLRKGREEGREGVMGRSNESIRMMVDGKQVADMMDSIAKAKTSDTREKTGQSASKRKSNGAPG